MAIYGLWASQLLLNVHGTMGHTWAMGIARALRGFLLWITGSMMFDARVLKDIDSDGSDAADAFQDCFSLSGNLAMSCERLFVYNTVYYSTLHDVKDIERCNICTYR